MIESIGGFEPTRDNSSSDQDPITAGCFLPPPIPYPRPWQRVAVAPVPGLRRQNRIWKRVGGLVAAPETERYCLAMAELESQGQEPRKRARQVRHIPAWGTAKWDPRAEEGHDGKRDLREARDVVSAHRAEAARADANDYTKTKRATFPEERLKWVPRKRHNSRWPIEPKEEKPTSMVADLQPLIEFEVPACAEPVEATVQIDEKRMGTRSTRRLSRRISQLPMINLSPAKSSGPVLSPVKRQPVTPSPTKVVDSPLRSFRVNATPTKVVLESPTISPPERSPSKLSNPSTMPTDDVVNPATEAAGAQASTPHGVSSAPLMFDQPTPERQMEAEHETRRRALLYSARRNDRGLGGAARLLALKSKRNSPNRRHSFASIISPPVDVRGTKGQRRNTMDGLCVGPDEIREIGAGGEEDTGAAAGHYKADEVVEIDVKTNLDIFGQPIKAVDSAPGQHSVGEEEMELSEPILEPASPATSASTVASPVKPSLEAPIVISNSSEEASSVAEEADAEAAVENGGSPSQPATRPNATETESMKETPVTHVDEDQSISSEGQLSEISFASHDSEGLSTIYEESSLSEPQSSGEVDTLGLAKGETTVNADVESTALAALEVDGDKSGSAPPSASYEQPTVESTSETACSLAAPTSDVATAADGLTPSDPPRRNNVPSSTNTTQRPLLETENESSPGISEGDAVWSYRDDELNVTMPGASETDEHSKLCVEEPEELRHDDLVQDDNPPELPRFIPINGEQKSSLHATHSSLRDEEPRAEHNSDSDPDDADEVVEEEFLADEDHDAADAMDDDMLAVNPPCPANDTLQLQAMHDDSETEMLRKFVTRVAADKSAKALAAASTVANNSSRSARRSGSLGLTTSAGSPMAKSEPGAHTMRKPLAEKSSNSPSPTKNKRNLELIVEGPSKAKDGSQDPEDDLEDGPRIKRRRKRADPVLDTATVGTTAPASTERESLPSGPAPRRSTRARSLKPAAPSANSIAFSMIPVRLPGMGAMDDAALESHYAAIARQRSEEKDLAAITRVNTRKNKGGAVPPQVVLAKQAEDPNWRLRELKGVLDAKERRQQQQQQQVEGDSGDGKKNTRNKAAKGVRWAEELVRFHEDSDAQPSVFRGLARGLLADVAMEDLGEADEIAEAEPPAAPEPAVEKTVRVAARKSVSTSASSAAPVSSRRTTRSSRLPPPTPVKKMPNGQKKAPAALAEKKAAAAPAASSAPSLRTRAKSLPKPAASTAPSSAAGPAGSASTSSRSGMATRRTRIAKLGMKGNGTPAPKRRGRAAA
ncbi:uncharacterized protein B0T15DRAFT_533760 [Chaetomium strumarium]|uniref:Uncharacterized protein n=1 Tax=Chaetomium strumarium TaxID=1170767 RepID=A0AAJ0GTI7_9PEZI|nr:hypothetical protein B0T15DRAFT_533760 [Chaetomium strumarium]